MHGAILELSDEAAAVLEYSSTPAMVQALLRLTLVETLFVKLRNAHEANWVTAVVTISQRHLAVDHEARKLISTN